METTSYDEIKKEYSGAFKEYKKAHKRNMSNDCKETRDALRKAITKLNNTSFVQTRGL